MPPETATPALPESIPGAAPEREPVIIVENLTCRFGERTILENVSFQVYRGEVFVVLGGSGCGAP